MCIVIFGRCTFIFMQLGQTIVLVESLYRSIKRL